VARVWKLGASPGIGRKSYTQKALERGFVALGYSKIRDLRKIASEQALFRELKRLDRYETRNSARHLWLFSHANEGIRKNDIVLLYDHGEAWVARVSSRYYRVRKGSRRDYFSKRFDGYFAPHRLGVRWLYRQKNGKIRKFAIDGRYWEAKVLEIKPGDINKVEMEDTLRTFLQREMIPRRELKKIRARKYGFGGEGKEHKRLKGWIYRNPGFLHVTGVTEKWIDPGRPYVLPTLDLPDIVFAYGKKKYLAVEIETDFPEPGAYQALKYRTLIRAQKGLRLADSSISAALVAHVLDPRVKSFCRRYHLVYRVVSRAQFRKVRLGS
jgi:hypothetical protein